MTGVGGPAQRSARAELDAARSLVSGLDQNRGTEDLAADLVEIWTSMENALRSLVGTSVLSGQALIREARMRQLIDFDQANALAEFQAMRDRLEDTNYRPVEPDLASARNAFLRLDTALMTASQPPAAPRVSSSAAQTGEVKTMPPIATGPVKVVKAPRRFPVWAMAAAAVVVVVAVVLLIWRPWSGGSSVLDQGITAYRNGQREAAVSFFSRATRDKNTAVIAHVYLARMAREVGNFTLASQELQLALQDDPTNAVALREMGANLLAQQNYELARRFYVRAVQADPTDKISLGYLGCTLMRLNRTAEATNFFNRAGPGPWTNCTPAPAQSQGAQVIPP